MAILEGTAYWASITTPNTTFEPVYTVNLVVDDETANEFASRGHKVKQMDEGPAVIIKRKVNGPNGMVRPAPRLMDAEKQEVTTAVGNGSKIKVQYNEYSGEGKFDDLLDARVECVEIPPEQRDDIEIVSYATQEGNFTKTTLTTGPFINWGLKRTNERSNIYGGSSVVSGGYNYTLPGDVELTHPSTLTASYKNNTVSAFGLKLGFSF